MINIFIFYYDYSYLSELSNTLVKKFCNLNLIGFNSQISKINIVTCNLNMPHIIIADKYSHQRLAKLLKFSYIAINISQNKELRTEKIINQINKFIIDSKHSQKLNLFNFRKQTYYELKKFNFNFALSGTLYLLDCITYIHENPYYNLNATNINTLIKPIAEKYNISTNAVIWNINTSIEDMCKNTSRDFKKNIYGAYTKITLQSVIRTFTNLY